MKINKLLYLFLFTILFSACSSDDNNDTDSTVSIVPSQGAFVLNNGNFGDNNASLAFYNQTKKQVSPDVFRLANDGLKLGDTAQDLLIVDNSMYIAVYNSRVIYLTDSIGKLKKEIVSSTNQYPRSLAADANYVYVVYYDGFLARIDRKTKELDPVQVAVGRNPEQVKVSNGKIYVANSGGLSYPNYDNTVSVVDAATFKKDRDVTVVINPTKVEVAGNGKVYVISSGNYGDIPNTLQSIDPQNNYKVDSIGSASMMTINPDGSKLYTIYSPVGSNTIEYKVYDVNTAKFLDKSFVNSDVTFSATPSCLNIDPLTNNIYIGTSDYRNNAEMYIISPNRTLVNKFNTQGLNPMGAYFFNEILYE